MTREPYEDDRWWVERADANRSAARSDNPSDEEFEAAVFRSTPRLPDGASHRAQDSATVGPFVGVLALDEGATETWSAERAALVRHINELTATLESTRDSVEVHSTAAEEAHRELADLRAELESLQQGASVAHARLADTGTELERAHLELDDARTQLDVARSDLFDVGSSARVLIESIDTVRRNLRDIDERLAADRGRLLELMRPVDAELPLHGLAGD